MKSKSRFIAMFACLLMVSACSGLQPGVKLSASQQNLLKKCPETLPEPTDGTGGALLFNGVSWAYIYHDCMTRHNGLVDVHEAAE